MVDSVAYVIIAVSLVLALATLVVTLLSRPVGRVQLGGLALVELGMLAQVVLAITKLAGGDRPDGGMAIFIGYLAGSLVILPIAGLWGIGDRSRWGSGVVAIGYLVIAVLIVRMRQVWHV